MCRSLAPFESVVSKRQRIPLKYPKYSRIKPLNLIGRFWGGQPHSPAAAGLPPGPGPKFTIDAGNGHAMDGRQQRSKRQRTAALQDLAGGRQSPWFSIG